MSKLNTMEKLVLQILEDNPQARKDDYILMLLVCEKLGLSLLEEPFSTVMKYHKINGLPNWETVTRSRRKIQAKRPDLVSPETAKHRHEEEAEYREYAIS